MIEWEASTKEKTLIGKIARRALDELNWPPSYDIIDLRMNVAACHLNGCPLDLSKLLKAPKVDFAHDLYGIDKHIDRDTGKLRNHFLPRCHAHE